MLQYGVMASGCNITVLGDPLVMLHTMLKLNYFQILQISVSK